MENRDVALTLALIALTLDVIALTVDLVTLTVEISIICGAKEETRRDIFLRKDRELTLTAETIDGLEDGWYPNHVNEYVPRQDYQK